MRRQIAATEKTSGAPTTSLMLPAATWCWISKASVAKTSILGRGPAAPTLLTAMPKDCVAPGFV